jgi:hypothetical protein
VATAVAMAAASAGRPEIFTLCAKKITLSSRGCCKSQKMVLVRLTTYVNYFLRNTIYFMNVRVSGFRYLKRKM